MLIIAKKREIVNCEYYHFWRVNFPHFLKPIIANFGRVVNGFLRLNSHKGEILYNQKNPLKSRTCGAGRRGEPPEGVRMILIRSLLLILIWAGLWQALRQSTKSKYKTDGTPRPL